MEKILFGFILSLCLATQGYCAELGLRIMSKIKRLAMKIYMFFSGKNNKIFYPIIKFISVDMVYYFRRIKVSTKFFFHNKSMFCNSTIRTGKKMVGVSNTHISQLNTFSILPFKIIYSNILSFFEFSLKRKMRSFFVFIPRSLSFFKSTFRNKAKFFSFIPRDHSFFINIITAFGTKTIFAFITQFCKKFLFTNWTKFQNSVRSFIFTSFWSPHFSSKIKAAFSLLKKEWLPLQDLLTANFRHKKSTLSLASVIIALVLGMSTQSFAANEWRKGTGEEVILGTQNASDIDIISFQNIVDPLDRLLANYRRGVALTYASASTITIGSGEIVCSNSAETVRKFRKNTSSITTDWTATYLDSGVEASSTYYYVYAISDTDATTFTVKISTNSSAPTGATYYRRLGSFYNDASGNITQIVNNDNSGNVAFIKGQGNYYKIDSGTTGACGNQSYQELAVSFTFTFASAPKVVISANGSWGSLADYYTLNITTTGFTLATGNNYPVTYNYVAMGQVLAQ